VHGGGLQGAVGRRHMRLGRGLLTACDGAAKSYASRPRARSPSSHGRSRAFEAPVVGDTGLRRVTCERGRWHHTCPVPRSCAHLLAAARIWAAPAGGGPDLSDETGLGARAGGTAPGRYLPVPECRDRSADSLTGARNPERGVADDRSLKVASYQPSARSRLYAALINAKWVNACGKLPRSSPLGPTSSENKPTWFE
jgi:hypothetical protein